MNIRIENATVSVYEDNPHFAIINNCNSTDIIEVAIAVFTPAESDYGESHVIEHCIASDLSKIVGNLGVVAYVFHNITFFNFNIQKSNIYLLRDVMEKLFNPEFLVDENIYFRESHNVQSDSRGKRVGGIVFNEILEKSKNKKYVLLRNIPKLLSKGFEYKGISGGTIEGILQLTYNKCKEYFYKYYSWSNVCISILGNFSETDKENIVQLFKKYKKCQNRIKKNDVKVNERKEIEKYKLPYISEYENGNMYSIILKLCSPGSMTEYNFYLWLKETIESECLKKGFICHVEFRNIIDYAYITVFFDIFNYKRSIYKVLQSLDYILCYNNFMSSSTNYIMKKIVGEDNYLNNEKVIQFLGEAFFDNKFILNYIITEKKIEMKRIKEILEGIELCELEVYPETMLRYERLIQKYMNSEYTNSYKPDSPSINWKQIRLGKKNNSKTNLALKPYYKETHMGIKVCFFDDIECWVKLFYDITEMRNRDLLLLYLYKDIIAQLIGQKTIEILPAYNYEKKISKTYLIIKTDDDIKKTIENLFETKLDKKKLYKTLYLYRGKDNGCSYNESLNFLVTHMLSFFRICEMHKDLLYGLGRRIYIDHALEYLANNGNIELSISDIFVGNLEAIGTSYKGLNDLAELDKFLGKKRQEINIRYIEKPENCLVKNEAWYVAGMDIRNETRGLIDKFKVICKIITDLYLLPFLRDNGMYYGELNIIEDVLILIINNHGLYISMNDIANDIKKFMINSEENIINIFQDLYNEFYKEKKDRYSSRNDGQILCDLLDEMKRDVYSKEIQISHKELGRIINIIMKFPQKSKIGTLQNNNRLNSNCLENGKIQDCIF